MFNRIGERNPNRTIPRLMDLTRHLWEGERQKAGHHRYDGRIPIIATGLNNLRKQGPEGLVFLRFGRDHMEPLRDAIGNPRREAADARAREETALGKPVLAEPGKPPEVLGKPSVAGLGKPAETALGVPSAWIRPREAVNRPRCGD